MKNLIVTGITLKQDGKVYLSHFLMANPSVWELKLNWFKHDAEYSGKKVPIEQIDYRVERLDTDEIIVSGDIAKELGVTIGDKINIKLKLLGKKDNYIGLYEKNHKKFVKYFEQQSLDDKKKVIKELLEQDFVNEKIVEWLDKNYSSLIREVGLE